MVPLKKGFFFAPCFFLRWGSVVILTLLLTGCLLTEKDPLREACTQKEQNCPINEIKKIYLQHPHGPTGYMFETKLRPFLGDRQGPFLYALRIQIQESNRPISLDPEGLPIRKLEEIHLNFFLSNFKTGKGLFSKSFTERVVFNISPSPAASEENEETAKINAITTLTQKLLIVLETYFFEHNTKKLIASHPSIMPKTEKKTPS